MKRVIKSERVVAVIDTTAYLIGVTVLAFIASTAITLSSLTVGYGLADIVYAITAPPDWKPTWDYTTNTAVWKTVGEAMQENEAIAYVPLVQDSESAAFNPCAVPENYFDNAYQRIVHNPTNDYEVCPIPPVQENEEAAYPMDVQDEAVNTVYIKPSP